MKKHILLTVIILIITGISHLSAQNRLSFSNSLQVGLYDEDQKSVSQARGIAFTNTLFPMATGIAAVSLFDDNTVQTGGAITTVYGLIMGPSTGNFYASDYGRGLAGIIARSAGVYLMADATSEIFGRSFADALNIDDQKVSLTDTKILIGEILVLGSAVYNIISAGASVREYNEGRPVRVGVSSASIAHSDVPVLMAKISF